MKKLLGQVKRIIGYLSKNRTVPEAIRAMLNNEVLDLVETGDLNSIHQAHWMIFSFVKGYEFALDQKLSGKKKKALLKSMRSILSNLFCVLHG